MVIEATVLGMRVLPVSFSAVSADAIAASSLVSEPVMSFSIARVYSFNPHRER